MEEKEIEMNLSSDQNLDVSPSGQGASSQFSGVRILLVEDNEINRELMLDILTHMGIVVETAFNGAEALEKLSFGHYAAILMDCQMPVMNGFEASRKIRQNPAYEKLPILAMTANVDDEDKKKCLDAGMNAHIAKPFDIDQLLATLAHWLPKRRQEPVEILKNVLDSDRALMALSGNVVQYRMLLRLFLERQKDAAEKMRSFLAETQGVQASRLLYQLKNLAAHIGAFALSEAAAGIEADLQSFRWDQARSHLPVFTVLLNKSLQEAEAYLAAEGKVTG